MKKIAVAVLALASFIAQAQQSGNTTGGGAPSGPAGGGLAGTYPNPTVAGVPCSALPAGTGDATRSAGSCVETVVAVNGTNLAGLGTGLVKNTTGTGVPSVVALPLSVGNGGTGATTLAGAGIVQGSAAIPATQYLLPVASGAAGTLGISTLKLNGSALFPTSDSTTAVQIDKADGTTNVLTVDTTNGRLGFGVTAAPSFTVDVASPDATPNNVVATSYGTSGNAGTAFVGRFARNTQASPSAVLSSNLLARFAGRGFGATVFSGTRGSIDIDAAENWTDAAQGTYIAFLLTSIGQAAANEKMRLFGSGGLALGSTTDPGAGGFSASGLISTGTKFTTSGCSVSSTTGGAAAGTFTVGANNCTVIITINGATGLAAPNGWNCSATDQSALTILVSQSASSTTTCSINIPVTAGATDVIRFTATGY